MILAVRAVAPAFLLVLSACAIFGGGRERAEAPPPADWRSVATEADRERLRTWRDAWMQALEKARSAGFAAEIARHGVLLNPDARLAGPAPPPGEYRCSVIKVGARGPGNLNYVAYPAFACRVTRAADGLQLAKRDGSQRPAGRLFADDAARMIFLGTMVLGDETASMTYGQDAERDMAGVVERIGPRRWRLVLPWPRWESTLDVVELVPAG